MLGLLQNTKDYIKYTLYAHHASLKMVFVTYILYISSHYIAPKAIYSSIIFYVLTTPSMLYYLYMNPKFFNQILDKYKFLLFLFAYLVIHSIYMMHEMETYLFIKGVRNICATFLFTIVSLIFFDQSDVKVKNMFFYCLCIVGIIFTIVSFVKYFYLQQFLTSIRLVPFGFARHEILGASLYGMIGLISLHSMFITNNLLYKLFYSSLSILILILILLTFSRGPIIAYGLCCVATIIIDSQNHYKTFIYLFITLILLTVTLFVISLYTDIILTYLSHLIDRGTSFRIVLWKLTISKIIDKPILGYGIRNIFISEVPGGYSPHNVYLSTAYYFGIPTLLMLITIMVKSIAKPLLNIEKGCYAKLIIILFLHAILSTMTDHGQLARGNTPIWVIFWLPICMALAYNNKQEES